MHKGKIVKYGLVDDIRKNMSATITIRIGFLGEEEKTTNLLDDYPNIKIVNLLDNVVTMEFDGELEELAALNAHLVSSGIKVTAFTEEKMDLEEIFLQISAEA
jgi:ABC-type multidrug transport system ATPase subunit